MYKLGKNKTLFLLVIAGIIQMATGQAPMETRNIARFPAEWEPHKLTFMQWPTSEGAAENYNVWGDKLLPIVQKEIAGIAKAIADYEPVVVLVPPDQANAAEKHLEHGNIRIEKVAVDDLWARDTMPAFRFQGEELQGVSLNFNGWGSKQEHKNDAQVATKIAAKYNMTLVKTWLVGEGGSLENDGAGTLLVTESSLVNKNRNPGKTRDDIEKELKLTLGVQKVIWFKGVYGKDITDAHVDCMVRFLSPGVVLLNRAFKGVEPDEFSNASEEAFQVLKKEKDARGKSFEIIDIFEPNPANFDVTSDEFVSSYVNFYIANGAVIIPQFGDKDADMKAQKIFADNFPGRVIVPVNISAIASGGGGIHCSTHELPSSSAVVTGSLLSKTGLFLTGAVFGIFNGGL